MNDNWELRLALVGPFGEHYTIALAIGAEVMREIAMLDPPHALHYFSPTEKPMETAIRVMRRRRFRKDLFINECARLGVLLAERMEDKEGWHGVERADRLKDWGR